MGFTRHVRPGFTKWDLLVVLLIVAGLIGFFVPVISNARISTWKLYCANNLKQIALAVESYRETRGAYPTGTIANPDLTHEKRLSWLVKILPFLEQDNLYNAISKDRAWDDQTHDAVNRKSGGGG